MEAQVANNSEFIVLKDTVWKLSSRVLLLEGFIKKQFGAVFWSFCEDQVQAATSTGVLSDTELQNNSSVEDEDEDEDVQDYSEELLEFPGERVHQNLPNMIPMYTTVLANPNITITTTSSSGNSSGGAVIVNKNSKPIPPPPPLSCMSMKQESNHSNSSYQYKPRNFLPKSLAPKPKLTNMGGVTTTSGGNCSIIVKNKDPAEESLPSNSNADSLDDSLRFVKTEPQNPRNKSPATVPKPTPRFTLSQVISKASPIQGRKPSIGIGSSVGSGGNGSGNNHFHHNVKGIKNENLWQEVNSDYNSSKLEYSHQNYYTIDSESDQEDEDSQNNLDGYLPSELVAATLSPPGEDGSKRMRYSFATSSSSMNGTTPRQMRPNPCHTRCQNRCHDIWTDGDRMGVFETYWNIPAEEERREWVAQRIERVDMATKRTEFSNFRTCTFKYYLPHPDNPWVQVCKNFFLATIDEKRSYIEKIAQSVKGETEKMSPKDIPFRRRNQMRGMEYVGWMTGVGGEQVPIDPDNPEHQHQLGQEHELGHEDELGREQELEHEQQAEIDSEEMEEGPG